MKAYVVLTLLLISYIDGYETEDCRNFFRNIKQYFNNHRGMPHKDPVYFYLFTKDNPKFGQQLFFDDVDEFQKINFNFSKPTKFVTHGFLNSVDDCAVTAIRDAYLEHADYNIVGIDWSNITFLDYLPASERVQMASKFIADFINFLHKQGLDLSTVTIVGHSLGAHVAGLSARCAEGNVDLVVALDPAFPNFSQSQPGQRVARGDADYVQVIHTNAGVLGYERAIGDVDFYPNGGAIQPGCTFNTCSHLRSYEYFAESINSDKFVAVACENYSKFKKGACKSNAKVAMGGVNPDRNIKGTYYLFTNRESPYAQGVLHNYLFNL